MGEPSTYCGASYGHAICENYKFLLGAPLKMFQKDEICPDITWLDLKNCTGILDHNTFKNVPNLEILNCDSCTFEDIKDDTFSTMKSLKSMDVWKSTLPLSENTFENCENLDSLRFVKLEHELKTARVFKNLKKLASLTFDHISGLELCKDTFLGLENLEYLFITKCTIDNIAPNAFDNLKSLETFYFSGNTVENFSSEAFMPLTNLKIFGLHDNVSSTSGKLNIDYQIFENLPLLETVSFPEEHLKLLDFSNFKSLKNVQLVIGKASNDVIELLEKKNVNMEWITDTDLTDEVDMDDPGLQICC